MFRYIFKFSKLNKMKYISHLDLMSLFQRVFRRAEIKIAYSQGFSPHPKLSIAHPLSLGISSVSEYMEVEIINEISDDILKNKLNSTLPQDIEILECRRILKNNKSLAALVAYGEYDISFKLTDDIDKNTLENIIIDFLSLDEIIATKRQIKKNLEKRINIRPFIKNINILSFTDNECKINIIINTGSNGNLNPELFLESLLYYSNLNINSEYIEILRQELYMDDLIPLSEIK